MKKKIQDNNKYYLMLFDDFILTFDKVISDITTEYKKVLGGDIKKNIRPYLFLLFIKYDTSTDIKDYLRINLIVHLEECKRNIEINKNINDTSDDLIGLLKDNLTPFEKDLLSYNINGLKGSEIALKYRTTKQNVSQVNGRFKIKLNNLSKLIKKD